MNQLQAFIEKAKNDKALMAKLNKIGADGAEVDKVVSLAAEYGFGVTAEDCLKAMETACPKTGKLAEEELEAVAGGVTPPTYTKNRWDPDECKKLKTTAMRCFGMGLWCDHYRMLDGPEFRSYWHICKMGVYNYWR